MERRSDMIILSFQAFLGIYEPAYRYFFVLGLHLFSLGWFHFAQAPGIKFFSSPLYRRDSCCKPKIARILLGTVFSVSVLLLQQLLRQGRMGGLLWLAFRCAWSDLLHFLGSSLALAPSLADQRLHQNLLIPENRHAWSLK